MKLILNQDMRLSGVVIERLDFQELVETLVIVVHVSNEMDSFSVESAFAFGGRQCCVLYSL